MEWAKLNGIDGEKLKGIALKGLRVAPRDLYFFFWCEKTALKLNGIDGEKLKGTDLKGL